MNYASIIGIILGVSAILGGNYFEGGSLFSVLQPTAAFIVFGGTLGATLVSFPLGDISKAISSLKKVFFENKINPDNIINDLMRYSYLVRKNGIIALEAEIAKIEDKFLKKALTLVVDHMTSKTLREIMEVENLTYESEKRRIAKVYDTAGGFAPTIGILGAVLGLIQVMENLSDPSKLGSGIAVAFVATIYGVGLANLILLPISRKLINELNSEMTIREMIIEGVVGIQAGMHPYYLKEKLKAYVKNYE